MNKYVQFLHTLSTGEISSATIKNYHPIIEKIHNFQHVKNLIIKSVTERGEQKYNICLSTVHPQSVLLCVVQEQYSSITK